MAFLRRHLEVSVFSCLAATLADGSCSMNTALSGSGRVDDIKGHPQGEIRGETKLVKPEFCGAWRGIALVVLIPFLRKLITDKAERPPVEAATVVPVA